MLYYYRKGKKATQAAKEICDCYGASAVTDRVVQKWYARFRSGEFELTDVERSGRPVTIDTAKIMTVVHENPHFTLREIADIVKVSHVTVQRHLHAEGYVNRADVWVPKDLNKRKLTPRFKVAVTNVSLGDTNATFGDTNVADDQLFWSNVL
ncbi:PREDICTED: histone-lysine N-methyltransferase SETMAR-like [Nicrophorus vespilloides]|uniref:Histone-lysine N-methyltransferase SETMAR-like n=1 Tax=Nicrophorus vespilloides TaxID=110193 RepID=A0ABM1MUQ0_NICVS|nr:PREDICTED: histone-lysine N-methyltransferase SETMAR-like [Nicrophorus vespilloides]